MKTLNMIKWKFKNRKKRIIADIIKYNPDLEKNKKQLFKKSKYDLHYLRWHCLKSREKPGKSYL